MLRTIKLGEADRIVTILTQGAGKVRAVAKGVRKTTSKFGARLEPTSRVALQCYRGRELDVVTQVETLDPNRALREDYTLLHPRGADARGRRPAGAREGAEPGPLPDARRRAAHARGAPLADGRAGLLLEGALSSRDSAPSSTPVRDAGVTRRRRGARGDRPRGGWNALRGVCARAAAGAYRRRRWHCSRRVLGGDLNAALGEPAGRAVAELEHLGVAALEHHLERRLRSAALL